MEDFNYKKPVKNKKIKKLIYLLLIGFFLFSFFITYLFVLTSSRIPTEIGKKITIPTGYTIDDTIRVLKNEKLIDSSLLIKILIKMKHISPKQGTYSIKPYEDIFSILERINNADYGDVYIKITIPEGSTNKQIKEIFSQKFSDNQTDFFNNFLIEQEGILFPDTYYFLPDTSFDNIMIVLKEHFQKKLQKAFENKTVDISDSDLIIMASLIEKESGINLIEKQMISGILWKRISQGMLLQIDAPFIYERSKGSAQLTRSDLKTDSPYNTYTRKGLTPTAIGNPGFNALYAAAHPIESPYYFYLHGGDGSIHYAISYNEHLKNKRKYLQ